MSRPRRPEAAQRPRNGGSLLVLAAIVGVGLFGTGPATAATLRVPADFPTIQAGLDAAVDGDTVLVAPGTYRGAGNRSIRFPGTAVVLTSEEGAEATILDAEASASNPGRGFLFDRGEGPDTVVDGFTIENGWMSTEEDRPSSGLYASFPDARHDLSGAGFKINFGSPTIRNLIVRRCHSEYTGGGASVEAAASPTIRNVRIEECSAGIQGGGISIETSSTAQIEDCVFTGNSAPLGGGLANHATVILVGCTIAGNRAEYGGGVALYTFTQGTYERTLIWGNCATEEGDQIWADNGAGGLSLSCCIVDEAGVFEFNAGTIEWNDSVSADPLFCDPGDCAEAPLSGGDYSPSAGSPALPSASPCEALIGAVQYGACNVPPIRSWGRIKERFLEEGKAP